MVVIEQNQRTGASDTLAAIGRRVRLSGPLGEALPLAAERAA
jgi:hypothetical protein